MVRSPVISLTSTMNIAPSDTIEVHHVRRPTSSGAGTRNQSTRIDIGKYEYVLVVLTAAALTGTATYTPVMYAAASGGTGTRLDGSGGQPDYRIGYSATEDNLAVYAQIRCGGLPGQWLGFEEVFGNTNTLAVIVVGVLSATTPLGVNYALPITADDGRKVAQLGFA